MPNEKPHAAAAADAAAAGRRLRVRSVRGQARWPVLPVFDVARRVPGLARADESRRPMRDATRQREAVVDAKQCACTGAGVCAANPCQVPRSAGLARVLCAPTAPTAQGKKDDYWCFSAVERTRCVGGAVAATESCPLGCAAGDERGGGGK